MVKAKPSKLLEPAKFYLEIMVPPLLQQFSGAWKGKFFLCGYEMFKIPKIPLASCECPAKYEIESDLIWIHILNAFI